MNPAWLPNIIVLSPNRMIIQSYPEGGCFCFDPTTKEVIWTIENRYSNSRVTGIRSIEDKTKFKAYFCNGVEHEVSAETGKLLDEGLLVK